LSTAALARVQQASICIIVNDPEQQASFSAQKTASGWTVTDSTGYCSGLKSEDVVIQFPTYEAFSSTFDNPSPKNIAKGAIDQTYQILESKYVQRGGNVICDAAFKVKYCSALTSMATASELIDADMVCCLDKLTTDQQDELRQHLQDGNFKDEIGLITEKPASAGMSSTTLLMVGGAAALLMIVVVAVVMKGKPKKTKAPAVIPQMPQMQRPTEDPQVTELRNYVSQTLSQGYPAEDIRSHLIEIGWDQNIADKVVVEEYNKIASTGGL
jgi:hypothetical protein